VVTSVADAVGRWPRGNRRGWGDGIMSWTADPNALKYGIKIRAADHGPTAYGTFHSVTKKHLAKYLNEFAFRWNTRYEAANFRFADTNRRIGGATRDLLLGFYLPRRLVRIGRPVVHALLDRPLREAMGFPEAPWWLRRSVMAAMRMRAGVLRRLPPRRTPRHLTALPRPTYPEGYRIEELGTFAVAQRPPDPPRP